MNEELLAVGGYWGKRQSVFFSGIVQSRSPRVVSDLITLYLCMKLSKNK